MGCFFNLSKSSSINPNNVYIWNEYISDYKNNSIYSSQMAIKQISYKNKTMIFDYVVNGEVIENGYPLYIVLHDGEINNSAKNNAEYNQAKLRYLSSISVGIVLITRGISENSNMHYNTEGIVILDKLIKNFIAFKNVDPNRVYLIGIGFGGNAVYHILNKIPHRFAAGVVISGLSYGIRLHNLINVPLLIQVGEKDICNDRCKDSIKAYERLINYNLYLKDKDKTKKVDYRNVPKDLDVELYLYANKFKKDIFDNNNELYDIFVNPLLWTVEISERSNEKKTINTNSIHFLNRHKRKSLPNHLIWDLRQTIKIPVGEKKNINSKEYQTAKSVSKQNNTDINDDGFFVSNNNNMNNFDIDSYTYNQSFYWLEIGNLNIKDLGTLLIECRYDRKTNGIYIESYVKLLRILLNNDMLDLSIPVHVFYLEEEQTISLQHNFTTERRTLSERGDFNYIFSAAIIFECKDKVHFRVYQYEEM